MEDHKIHSAGAKRLSESVRVTVIGGGVFGAHHARKFAEHKDAALVGVFDVDRARASQIADGLGVIAYDDVDRAIREADAVVIAAPAIHHFDLAERALATGKHCFIEKPIACTIEAAQILVNSAREKGRVLQVGHQERYVFAASGLLGREKAPLSIRFRRSSVKSDRCSDVSVALDLMIHDLDLVNCLIESPITSISAHGDYNALSAELRCVDGVAIELSADRRAERPDRGVVLVYDDGVIELDFVNRTIANSTSAGIISMLDNPDAPLAIKDPLAFGADRFIHAILSQSKPIVSGEDGCDALSLALAIEEAALRGVTKETAFEVKVQS